MSATPDPQTVREITRTAVRLIAEDVASRHLVGAAMAEHGISHDNVYAWSEIYDQVIGAIGDALRPLSQPNDSTDPVSGEQQDGAAGRLRTAHVHRAEHGRAAADYDDDVAAVLAERGALTAGVAEQRHQPISVTRWHELRLLAWSPVYRPPAGTVDQVRHDALRDAVGEAERLRGLARTRWNPVRALLETLAEHRVVARLGHPYQQEPPLLTDLMQWAAITVEAETHLLREDTNRLQGVLELARTAADRLRLARQAVVDDGYFTEGQVGDDVAPRIVELLAHYRQRLDELADPDIEWGHQILSDDGHRGDEVGQGDEDSARAAVRYLNTMLPATARAVLVQREVRFHATRWREVRDA